MDNSRDEAFGVTSSVRCDDCPVDSTLLQRGMPLLALWEALVHKPSLSEKSIMTIVGDPRCGLDRKSVQGEQEFICPFDESTVLNQEGGATPLLLAVLTGRADVLSALLQAGADASVVYEKQNLTALHVAASIGCASAIEVLLKTFCLRAQTSDNKFGVFALDSNGCTPLHLAASKGRLDCIALLVDGAADVSSRDWRGMTPLHYCAWGGHTECLDVLIARNSDVNAEDNSGNTALLFAVTYGFLSSLAPLLASGANLNIKNRGNQKEPLHVTATYGSTDCLQKLLDAGADMEALDLRGWTPLHNSVCTVNNRLCVKLLLSEGADVHVKDLYGRTPIDLATKLGFIERAELLLSYRKVDQR